MFVAPPTGFTVSVERIHVRPVAQTASVSVEPLLGRVTLLGLSIVGKTPTLCPRLENQDGAILLQCKTRRLWAELVQQGKETFVELREIAGISWQDADAQIPLRSWPLLSLSLPDHCPGTLPATRGECALAAGQLDVARAAWNECLKGPDVNLCRVRLGDLAFREGDIEEALAQWKKVTPVGPIGRMASMRKCELLGSCLVAKESDKMASTDLLPQSMAQEVTLHAIRRELFAGRDAHALELMVNALQHDRMLCHGAVALCQKFIAAGLGSEEPDARIAALSTFLHDEVRGGPSGYRLNQLASQTATELGAYAFAAAILAANTPHVPRNKLPSHLYAVIDLYLRAEDPIRAGVVFEYAESKLGTAVRSAQWNSLRVRLKKGMSPSLPVSKQTPPTKQVADLSSINDTVYISTDLARAAAALSRANTQDRIAEEKAP